MGCDRIFAMEQICQKELNEAAASLWPDNPTRAMWIREYEGLDDIGYEIASEVAEETARIRMGADITFELGSDDDDINMIRVVNGLLQRFPHDAALFCESKVYVLRRGGMTFVQRDPTSFFFFPDSLAQLTIPYQFADIAEGGKILKVYPSPSP